MKIKKVFPFLLFIFAIAGFCAYLGFSLSFKKIISISSFVLVFISHIIRVLVFLLQF
jgi:hypothetical protein